MYRGAVQRGQIQPYLLPSAHPLPQHRLQHLPVVVLWQRVHHFVAFGPLEARNMLQAMDNGVRSCLLPSAHPLPQQRLQHLPVVVLRQRVHELIALGPLKAGNLVQAKSVERL